MTYVKPERVAAMVLTPLSSLLLSAVFDGVATDG